MECAVSMGETHDWVSIGKATTRDRILSDRQRNIKIIGYDDLFL
ncbi:MAG TPA: hypothetical protein V6D33_15775 [Cyanophyceae cyanobacterium]